MNGRYYFRGKSINNYWVYGYLFQDRHFSYILQASFVPAISMPAENFIQVDPKTVCQCIGRKDKNNKLIYEGDTLQWNCCWSRNLKRAKVEFDEKSLTFWVGCKTLVDLFHEQTDEMFLQKHGFKADIPEIVEVMD